MNGADPKDNPSLLRGSFVFDLEPKDLQRLREITRRGSGRCLLTDFECDLIIEQLGPDILMDTLRKEFVK